MFTLRQRIAVRITATPQVLDWLPQPVGGAALAPEQRATPPYVTR